MITECKCS